MKPTLHKPEKLFQAAARSALLAALMLCILPTPAPAQTPPRISLPPGVSMGTPPSGSESSPSKPDAGGKDGGPWIPSAPLASGVSTNQAGGTNATDANPVELPGREH